MALNQARLTATINADYKFPRLPGPFRRRQLGAPTTLRVQVQNLTNVYFWNLSFNSPTFSQYQPRAFFAYLTADF